MGGLLGGAMDLLFGSEDPPAWQDLTQNTELGLNESLGYYNYDPKDLAGQAFHGALDAGRLSLTNLNKSKQEALNLRRRQASEMTPGMASFRAGGMSQGAPIGFSNMLGNERFKTAQKQGMDWADTNFNAAPYDLAAAEIPFKTWQTATPFLGMQQEAQKFMYTGARGAEATNKQFRVDTQNFTSQFNTTGRMNQANAGWQARQARANSILSGLFKVGGMALGGAFGGADNTIINQPGTPVDPNQQS